jgi:putative ABC transport system permease protein
MSDLWNDCKATGRLLAGNWRIVSVITLTIALAVAATATTLTVVSAVLLRPFPLPQSDRLYRVFPFNQAGEPMSISVPTLNDWKARARDATLAGYTVLDFNIIGDGPPQSILAARVTPDFFATMGMQPEIGRAFTRDDHGPAAERVAILSYEFWRSRFGSDRSVVGRRVRLSGPEFLPDSSGEYLVVGVLPERFWLFWKRTEVFIPLRITLAQLSTRRRPAVETVVARMSSTAAAGTLGSQFDGIVSALLAQYGNSEPVRRVSVEQAQTALYKDFTPRLFTALGSAAMMFVLSAVNVTAMLIALAVARQREFAIRAALGAQRRWFLRQALIEGALLGAGSGGVGFALSAAGVSLIRGIVPRRLVDLLPGEAAAITLDWRVVGIVTCAVVLMAVLCSLVTFSATGRARLEWSLRETSRASSDMPRYAAVRRGILAFQLALAIALVVATTVLAADLLRLQSTDLGITPDNVLSVWLNLDPRRHSVVRERAAYYERVLERVAATPGIVSVSGIDMPFKEDFPKTDVTVPEQRGLEDNQLPEVLSRVITPGYFATMGIRLVAGRAFDPTDADGSLPVAIVSQALANKLWPNSNSVGRQIRAGGVDAQKEQWLTVVGVVSDVRRTPQEPPAPTLYRPVRQKTPAWLYLMVRTSGGDVTRSLKEGVWAVDADQPIEGPFRVTTWVHDMTAPLRFVVIVGSTFSLLGALLAFTGVYGLTADVSQRSTREIGVRKALGATTGEIIKLYVVRSLRLCLPAVVVGSFFGVSALRLITHEIGPLTMSAMWAVPTVAGAFGALVILATFLSSRKAAGADPGSTMRAEP